MGQSAIDISALSPEERLELLERLWDSLDPEEVPLTEAQRAELKRRVDRMERDGAPGRTWDEVEGRILGRR